MRLLTYHIKKPMFWRYVEKQIKKNIYPNNFYWPHYMPRSIQRSIYRKYGLNVKFELIPERWSSLLYYWVFSKRKGYKYPTNDHIKFFYFTLFKKNSFLFFLFCCILYRNCFLEFVFLVLKALIAFYLIVWFIYIILLLRKYIYISIRIYKRLSISFIIILILIKFNCKLNKFLNNSDNKWYF